MAEWPLPTTDEPSDYILKEWMLDTVCEATDGCIVELDGTCSHGHPSWLVKLDII